MKSEQLEEKRAHALADLRNALGELKSGEGLATFVGGHGFQSRFFRFDWREPGLEISFVLPTARVLSDEASQAIDDLEAGNAIMMAIILLSAAQEGRLAGLGAARISVSCDDTGARYALYAEDGGVIEEEDEWNGLVERISNVFGDYDESLAIIWP